MTARFHNLELLRDSEARARLERLVTRCRHFAEALPDDEEAQASELGGLIASMGDEIRAARLALATPRRLVDRVIRLYKEPVGCGRLKVQLFPLDEGEAHPPHAHENLISCQLVLEGRARMTEYSIIDRPDPARLLLRAGPRRTLEPGDGVLTLARRNNVHWQEGLCDGTVILNINWQGFLGARADGYSGRRALAWDDRRPTSENGCYLVPLADVNAADHAFVMTGTEP